MVKPFRGLSQAEFDDESKLYLYSVATTLGEKFEEIPFLVDDFDERKNFGDPTRNLREVESGVKESSGTDGYIIGRGVVGIDYCCV